MGKNLRQLDRDWTTANMNVSVHIWVNSDSISNPLIFDTFLYDQDEVQRNLHNANTYFTSGKRIAYDMETQNIDNGRRTNTLILQGPVGTGKKFFIISL